MSEIGGVVDTATLVFILMAVGFLCGKIGLFTKEVQKKMTDVVLFVFLPCTIIGSFEIHVKNGQMKAFGLTLLLAAILQAFIQIFSYALYRKQPFGRKAVLRYASTVCNSGFFGMSILAALYGQEALSYGAIFLIPQRITMWTFSMSYFTHKKDKYAALKTLYNPNMVAVYIGVALLLTGLTIPELLRIPIASVSSCTLPVTMILCGSILTELRLEMLRDRSVWYFSFIRLLFIPAVSLGVCLLLRVPDNLLQIAVLMTGMPAGATTGLLAIKYDGDERLGSALIAVTTVLFVLLIPFWTLVVFPRV